MTVNPPQDEWEELLTIRQAYLAMYSFLDEYYQRTQAAEIGAMLGGLSLLRDGCPADPACREDWLTAVRRASDPKHGGRLTGADI